MGACIVPSAQPPRCRFRKNPDEIADILHTLLTHGFVIVSGAISLGVCEALREELLGALDDFRCQPHLARQAGSASMGDSLPLRFSLNDPRHWSSESFLDLYCEILRFSSVLRGCLGCVYADCLGGDVVIEGEKDPQEVHMDFATAPGFQTICTLVASVALQPVDSRSGAMRIFTYPSMRGSCTLLPESKSWNDPDAVAVEMSSGDLLLRDVNAWHAGAPCLAPPAHWREPSTSMEGKYVRILASARFVSLDLLRGSFRWRPRRCIPDSLFQTYPAAVGSSLDYLWLPDQQGSKL